MCRCFWGCPDSAAHSRLFLASPERSFAERGSAALPRAGPRVPDARTPLASRAVPVPGPLPPSSAEPAPLGPSCRQRRGEGALPAPASRTAPRPALPSGGLRRGRRSAALLPSLRPSLPPSPAAPGPPAGWRGASAGAPPARGRAGSRRTRHPPGCAQRGGPAAAPEEGASERSAGGRGAAAPKNCSRQRGTQIRREQRTSHQSRLVSDCSAAEGERHRLTERGERQSRARRRRVGDAALQVSLMQPGA